MAETAPLEWIGITREFQGHLKVVVQVVGLQGKEKWVNTKSRDAVITQPVGTVAERDRTEAKLSLGGNKWLIEVGDDTGGAHLRPPSLASLVSLSYLALSLYSCEASKGGWRPLPQWL